MHSAVWDQVETISREEMERLHVQSSPACPGRSRCWSPGPAGPCGPRRPSGPLGPAGGGAPLGPPHDNRHRQGRKQHGQGQRYEARAGLTGLARDPHCARSVGGRDQQEHASGDDIVSKEP